MSSITVPTCDRTMCLNHSTLSDVVLASLLVAYRLDDTQAIRDDLKVMWFQVTAAFQSLLRKAGCDIPEKAVLEAVKDVIETSGFSEEGADAWNDGDVVLACQRVIALALTEF